MKGYPVNWPEATGAAVVIPDNSSYLSAAGHVATISKREFAPNEAALQLECQDLTKIPKELLHWEQGLRRALLDCLSAVLATLTMAVSLSQLPYAAAMNGLLKLSLRPLWHATLKFFKARLDLLRATLKGCNKEGTLYKRLLYRSPSLQPSLTRSWWNSCSIRPSLCCFFLDSVKALKGS